MFRSAFVPALAASGATALLGACDKNGGARIRCAHLTGQLRLNLVAAYIDSTFKDGVALDGLGQPTGDFHFQ